MKPTYPPGITDLLQADLPPDPRTLPFTTVGPAEPVLPPGPDSNVLRVYQLPPGLGQWYAHVGDGLDRRSVRYGPCAEAAEALCGLADNLRKRAHQFDPFWEPTA